jgi:hypothetical protein
MKRLCIIGVLGVLLTLVMVLPVNAAVTQNVKVPLDTTVFVPCANGGAGEEVHLTGELHMLATLTEDGAGGMHIKWHSQPQGVSGVGLITGDKYRGTGVTQEETNIRPGGFPYEDTFVNNFRIIGQGKGNNYLVHQVLHVTINANGEITAEVDNYSVECK